MGNIPFDKAIGILKISDIFVNPSYNEGLPTSVLEAGVCHKAIIATNVGGTLEILTPNQSGIIIRPYSTQEIKNALEKLLDNPELCKILGRNARKEIEEKFNWQNTVDDYFIEINKIKNGKL